MYISKDASRIRRLEAQRARDNRAEIVKALSTGQVTRRDLFKWGIFTGAGMLAMKNGLSPFATSAYADIPTGTPRSPLFGAQKYTQPLPRLNVVDPLPLSSVTIAGEKHAVWPSSVAQRTSKRLSYHTEFSLSNKTMFKNPWTNEGPLEGRPPGEFFAHQRWEEFFPRSAICCRSARSSPTARRSTRACRFNVRTRSGRLARAVSARRVAWRRR